MAQVLPSPVDSVASAEAMEEEVDVDACLTGASVIDPVAPEEFLPVAAVVAPSAAPAVVVNVSASPRSVVEDDNAASQDCPSWPISSSHSLSLVHIWLLHSHFSRMVRWVLFLMTPVM